MIWWRLRRRRDQRGAGLAEFALVVPMILLLLFGAIDLGRAVWAYNTIANAARHGARTAAVNQRVDGALNCDRTSPNPLDWSARGCALNVAYPLPVQPANVTLTYAGQTAQGQACSQAVRDPAGGCIVRVTVTYGFTLITPINALLEFMGMTDQLGAIPMASASEMPIERVYP